MLHYTKSLSALLLLLSVGCAAPQPAAAPAEEEAAPAPIAGAPEEYANGGALVDTQWVLEHLDDANVRLVDVSSQRSVYQQGHLPGAVFVDWQNELTNPDEVVEGQILSQDQLSALFSDLGIENDDTVVFYDDTSSLFASRAYWVLKYYQHQNVHVYNGGSLKWAADGQELVREEPAITPSNYVAAAPDEAIRTDLQYVLANLDDENTQFCDARSLAEYTGEDVRAERGGTIPGSLHVDWVNAVSAEDGTFLPAAELYQVYTTAGFEPDKEIITYCQTGVRGAHTWFVLTELLGFEQVRNYDGSWAEYGNDPDAPIEVPEISG